MLRWASLTSQPLALEPLGPTVADAYGPEVPMGHALLDADLDDSIGVLKCYRGGRAISEWQYPSSAAEANNSVLRLAWYTARERFREINPDVVVHTRLVWIQGETDIGTSQAAYEASLRGLLNGLELFWGAVPVYIVGVNVNFSAGYSSAVRAAQIAVCADHPDRWFFVNPDSIGAAHVKPDNTHYTTSGVELLGDLIAAAILANGP
jgi:hypothetical protein